MSRIINKECIYCNKVIKYDTYWCKHLLTKRHLKNVEKKTSTTEVPLGTTKGTTEVPLGTTKGTTEVPLGTTKGTTEVPLTTIHELLGKRTCKYCNKVFKHKNHMYRHMKYYCKKNNSNNIINNTTNNNTTNNNTTNNTTNNTMNIDNKRIININNYGSEDYSSIDKQFLKKLSLYDNDVKRKLISTLDKLYIDDNTNHNVMVSNIDGNYCKVYSEDDKWELEKLDKVLDYRMYNSVLNIIRSVSKNSNDLESVIINKTMNNISKYQKYIEENKELDIDKKDKRDFEYIREDHKIKLYNLNN